MRPHPLKCWSDCHPTPTVGLHKGITADFGLAASLKPETPTACRMLTTTKRSLGLSAGDDGYRIDSDWQSTCSKTFRYSEFERNFYSTIPGKSGLGKGDLGHAFGMSGWALCASPMWRDLWEVRLKLPACASPTHSHAVGKP